MRRDPPRPHPEGPGSAVVAKSGRPKAPEVGPKPAARSRSNRGPAIARGPGRRHRRAAGDRRSQILAAALEVFSERGFHGARTRELAKRAGVSEALVFSHFPTKQALIRAILDLVGFEDRMLVMEERLSKMPPREAQP